LISQNQRPNQTENDVAVAFVNVFRSNVHQNNPFVLQKSERNGKILNLVFVSFQKHTTNRTKNQTNLGDGNPRLVVVFSDCFRMRQNLNQVDEHETIGQISKQIVDLNAPSFQEFVAPIFGYHVQNHHGTSKTLTSE
jgi:hypothetical protein